VAPAHSACSIPVHDLHSPRVVQGSCCEAGGDLGHDAAHASAVELGLYSAADGPSRWSVPKFARSRAVPQDGNEFNGMET
jgi:hypothetical protein